MSNVRPHPTHMRIYTLALLGSLTAAAIPASACSCASDERIISLIEAHGFKGRQASAFHGRVVRWIGPKEVEVEVIEAYTPFGGMRHLVATPGPEEKCAEVSLRTKTLSICRFLMTSSILAPSSVPRPTTLYACAKRQSERPSEASEETP